MINTDCKCATLCVASHSARTHCNSAHDGCGLLCCAAQAVGIIGGRLASEGSGNVTLQTVAAIASSGVDFISVGALTHSVKALDISLNIVAK